MARRRIHIDFVLTETGDYCIAVDLASLGVSMSWLFRELNRLTDDDIFALFRPDDGANARGPEGRWGLLDLDPYWIICQLKMTEPMTWQLGSGEGWLKITRLWRKKGANSAMSEMRRLEDEAERRFKGRGGES